MRLMEKRRGEASRETSLIGIRRTHIVRIKRRGGSIKGVGGFFEGILAMMVVTIGVLLLTSSLALSSRELKEADNLGILEEKCLNLRDKLLANSSIMRGTCLSYQSAALLRLSDLGFQQGFGGMLSLVEWNGSASVEICSLRTSDGAGIERATITTPVGVQHSLNDIRAGLLTVCVWEE